MKCKICKTLFREEIVEMSPRQYCYNRADFTKLKNGDEHCSITDFRPLTAKDEEELQEFFYNKNLNSSDDEEILFAKNDDKKQGHWVDDNKHGYICSVCNSGCLLSLDSDYFKSDCCPHCGAEMDTKL